MSDANSIPPRTLTWKIRHSAWLLAVILGVGSFSCIGFIYCAVRVRSIAWKRRAVVVTALSLVGLVLLAIPVQSVQDVGAGYAALLWLALIGYGLFVNRDYLQWRSARGPVPATTAPPASVIPFALDPSPVAVPENTVAASVETPVSFVEDPVVLDPLFDAPPEDSVPNSVAASVQAEGAPAATYDVPQIEPIPDDETGPAVSSWQQAEALATWHMQKLGFDDANMTPPGADGGLDVRATDAVAQVKHYATPIGAPVIQQLRGAAYGQGAALFYSLSGYTKAAVEYANDAAVALFTYDESGVVQPFNHAARILHDRAGGDAVFDAAEFENQAQIAAVLQQYFEIMSAKYMEIVGQAMAAANGDTDSPIFRSAAAETVRVQKILQSLQAYGDRVPSDRLIDASSEIGEAAIRLAKDLRIS